MTDEEMKNSLERHKLWQSGFDAGFKAGYKSPRDWTPCAEGLPTVTKRYNVTWIDLQDGQRYSGTDVYSADEKRWDNENQRYKVLAWQPLPEPWTGGLDGK